MNRGQIPQAMADNAVGAMVSRSDFPDVGTTRALAAGTLSLWGILKDLFEGESFTKYAKAPGFRIGRSGRVHLANIDGLTILADADVVRRPIATVARDLVHKDMDFDTAKAMTATMIANSDKTIQKAPIIAMPAVPGLKPLLQRQSGFDWLSIRRVAAKYFCPLVIVAMMVTLDLKHSIWRERVRRRGFRRRLGPPLWLQPLPSL